MKNNLKKYILHIPLFPIAILCFTSVGFLFYTSLILFNKLDEKVFNISSVIIPKDNGKNINILPLDNSVLKDDNIKEFFITKLLQEYLINRYTVNGNSYLMNENLDLSADSKTISFKKGILLKLPSAYIRQGQIMWNPAYENFISGTDGEKKEIENLIKSKTTRTVKLISPIIKNGDWWTTKIKFTYRTPNLFDRKKAKTETYKIELFADLTNFNKNSIDKLAPSSVFKLIVRNIKKTKLN